jgi:MFS family permease
MRATRHQQLIVAALYFGQSYPLAFLFVVLPLALEEAGYPRDAIGALVGLCMVPWVLKPVWSPMVDRSRDQRSWIIRGQLFASSALFLAAIAVAFGIPSVMLVVFCALTGLGCSIQDTATDGYAIAFMPQVDRGKINAAMRIGFILGNIVGLSGGSFLKAHIGMASAFTVTASFVLALACLLHHCLAPVHVNLAKETPSSYLQVWLRAIHSRLALAGIATAICMGLSGISGALIPLFLKGPGGISEANIGPIMAVTGSTAGLFGGCIGIWTIDRLDKRTAATVGITAGMVARIALACALALNNHMPCLVFISYYAFIQFADVYQGTSMLGLLMDCCDTKVCATQFTIMNSVAQLLGGLGTLLGGWISEHGGWSYLFVTEAMLMILPIVCVWTLLGSRRTQASTG